MKLLKVTEREWATLKETVTLGDNNFGLREDIYAHENKWMVVRLGSMVRNIAKRNGELLKIKIKKD